MIPSVPSVSSVVRPNHLLALIIGLLLGACAGLIIGWLHAPTARSASIRDLAQKHRDDYAIMIAAGYAHDRDLRAALHRLKGLDADDIGASLRAITERIIDSGSRSLSDIRLLARLTADIGGVTPIMAPFVTGDG